MRYFAGEFIREAVMTHTHAELPYQVAVIIERFQEEPQIVHIDAVIVVAKEAHKKIVIGARGALLKSIGTEARQGLEKLMERKIMLRTWVKVEENWPDHPRKAQELFIG
jgi:GTP-binding protein Era